MPPAGDRSQVRFGPKDRARLRAVVRQSLYALVAGVICFTHKPNLMTPEVFYDSCVWPIRDIILGTKRGWGGDPRAHLKSTRWTIGLPVWLSIQRPHPEYDSPEEYARATAWLKSHPWFKGPDQRILIASSSKDNAKKFLGEITRVYDSNALFRFLFPELCRDLTSDRNVVWNKEEITLPGRKVNYSEQYLETAGTTSTSTSKHYDLIIFDDPVNENNWQSEIEIQQAIDWLLLAENLLENPSREDPMGGVILGIGNYWTRYDVRGFVEDNLADTYDIWHRSGWRCAHCGVNRCIRGPECIPTREPLWPDRFSAQALDEMRQRQGPKIFSAQILNDPKDPDTIAFHREDLRWYGYDPSKREFLLYEGQTRHVVEHVPADSCRWFLVCDPATSTDPRSCRSAVGVFAEDTQGRLFLHDLVAERLAPNDLIERILDTWDRYTNEGFRVAQFGVESVAGQRFLVPALNNAAKLRSPHVLAIPYDPKMHHIVLLRPDSTLRKEDRIRYLLGWRAEQHTLFVNTSLPHLDVFLHEWDNFPAARSNDVVDMLAYAQFLCRGTSASTEQIERYRKRNRRAASLQRAYAYGGW